MILQAPEWEEIIYRGDRLDRPKFLKKKLFSKHSSILYFIIIKSNTKVVTDTHFLSMEQDLI